MAEQFKDVTIKVEDRSFPCHRCVLASVSPYFQAMFTSGFSEETKDEVELKSVSADVFEGVLKYLYIQENLITSDNVEEYLKAASCLQIDILQKNCEAVMKDNLDTCNVIGVWKLATDYSCEDLKQSAWKMLMKHFIDMSDEEEFLQLDKDDLIAIISDPSLNIEKRPDIMVKYLDEPNMGSKREDHVLEAVIKWIEQQADERIPLIPCILPHLKLPLMSAETLLTFMESYPHLYHDVESRKILTEAQRFHMLPECRDAISSLRAEHRETSDVVEMLLFIHSTPKLQIMAYSFSRKAWFRLCNLPEKFEPCFAVCKKENNLYVSGKSSIEGIFYKYITSNDTWKRLPSLLIPLTKHCMVCYKKDIIILGGKTAGELMFSDKDVNSSVQKYYKSEKTWKKIGHLAVPISSASAVVLEDGIFVLGGKIDSADKSVMVQRFDMMTSQSTVIAQLLEPVSITGAFVANDKIYMNTGRMFSVLEYNKSTKAIDLLSMREYDDLTMSEPTSAFHGGKWFIMNSSVGEGGKFVMTVIDMHNLEKENQIELPGTNFLKYVKMVKLQVPKRNLKKARVESTKS
ncbi:hypothetical protein FSP39_013061 [Pinctada imbricata]|uniref:BTB domain-containing protein n=1 Tax=Pinctada imbricata TaxID=66713 RepID=A0AA88XM78_PINIB|nr:hypothetical protein FSP39_013061 [Pinctada imbricata]